MQQPKTQNSRCQRPSPFLQLPSTFRGPCLNLRAHQCLDQLPLLPLSMRDACIGQKMHPVLPRPQPLVTVCQPEQTNQCSSRRQSKALCPKPSCSAPSRGTACQTDQAKAPRSQEAWRTRSHRWWHLCSTNFYPVTNLFPFLLPSECHPRLQNCPPSWKREGQGCQWGLRTGIGAVLFLSTSSISSSPPR